MKQIGRKLKLVWMIPFLVLSIAACGPEEEEPTAPEVSSVIELRLITDSNNSEVEKEVFRRFEEENPDLEIDQEAWGQWPRSYLTSDNPPALMAIDTGDWLFSVIDDGLVADISDVWEQSNLDDIYPVALQNLTMRGGKQYFLPIGYGWHAIYYNRAIFEQYDLQPPQTWDQLLTVADTLLANGIIPFSLPGRSEWIASRWFDYLNIRMNGVEFHRMLINGEVPYNDGRVQDVFLTWQFFFDQGYFIENPRMQRGFDSVTSLIRGDRDSPLTREKAAMSLISSGTVDELPMVFQNELDFFAFPVINDTIPHGEIVSIGGYIAAADSPNRLEAMRFLSFMTSPDVRELLIQGAGPESSFVPIHIGSDDTNLNPEIAQGQAIVQAASESALPFFWASPTEMRTKMNSAIGKFLRGVESDKVNVDEILATLEEERIKLLEQGVFAQR